MKKTFFTFACIACGFAINAQITELPNGNVGIGIANPVEKLHINGNVRGNASGGSLRVQSAHGYLELGPKNASWAHIYTDMRLRVKDENGNVGIGTPNPGAWKLAVNGKIRAKEIKVETGWADFVFEENYNLPTLKDVENHIKEKGHLKDIPSADEVAKNGIHLGKINSKLLQKIEELTLYTIKQGKEIKSQQNSYELQQLEIEDLKKKNKLLQAFNYKLLEFQKRIEKLENKTK